VTIADGVRLQALVVPGPAGPLEALLQERDGPPTLTAVVCHPHPLYGGTLHNKVVHRVAGALLGLGAAVLRFNFRGIGASAGQFDQGHGELDDARAAYRWLAERHPRARRWVAGFSFGSWVAARLAASESDCERMILVAPPVGTQDFAVLRDSRVAKLVLQGSADEICPIERLNQQYPEWAEPKDLRIVPGASHFFDKQLGPLADAMVEALSSAAAGPAA
jgi:alpha/beta superfamily hydrolase